MAPEHSTPAPLPGSRRPATVTTLVGPLIVIALAAAWLLREVPVERSKEAAEMDALVARTDPRIVILGNSLAEGDLDPGGLGSALGVPRNRIAGLSRRPRAEVEVEVGAWVPPLSILVVEVTDPS